MVAGGCIILSLVMWNDTDLPLAHLITFRCYGTWLHGDERGSTDRFHRRYKTPHIPGNERWKRHNTRSLKAEPVALNRYQRQSVEKAIRETCAIRRWLLHTVNVRTNHVHAVLSIGTANASRALNALKANATRQMRAGTTTEALGPTGVVSATYGMNGALGWRLTTWSMDREEIYRTLISGTKNPPATAGGTDLVATIHNYLAEARC